MRLDEIKGIGPKRIELLHAANIYSVRDILYYFPYRYKDTRTITPIASIVEGDLVSVECYFDNKVSSSYFNGLNRVISYAYDNSGKIKCVWFNSPWIKNIIFPNKKYIIYGRAYKKNNVLYLSTPSFENQKALIPVYKKISGISNNILKNLIFNVINNINEIEDIIPTQLQQSYNLLSISKALMAKHFPQNEEMLNKANQRLIIDNTLYYLELFSSIKKTRANGVEINSDSCIIDEYWKSFKFKPTEDQVLALNEIITDLRCKEAMSRLLQGDVGSGKTAVALGAAFYVMMSGYQCAYMAPTEVLAFQIFNTARSIFEKWGIEVTLLTSKVNSKLKKENYNKIENGTSKMIVGTHALFSEGLNYNNLGLIITDEQHRFGVAQRRALESKNNNTENVNVLLMSATPIPRSTALILLNDLDISTIKHMPKGRKPVKTFITPESKRNDLYQFVKNNISLGKQAYIICKLVENSDDDSIVYDVKQHYKDLSLNLFKNYRVGLLYGKQKQDEKLQIIQEFQDGKIDILVSTTVIEVGINVPNANIIIIENADMYGLSQLHQLRGRVGRDGSDAWCFLMTKPNDKLIRFCNTNDGFEISKIDFFSRGPGELLGLSQHGESELSNLLLNDGTENLVLASKSILEEIKSNVDYSEYYKKIKDNSLDHFKDIQEKITFA